MKLRHRVLKAMAIIWARSIKVKNSDLKTKWIILSNLQAEYDRLASLNKKLYN